MTHLQTMNRSARADRRPRRLSAALCLAALMLAGCSGYSSFRRAQVAEQMGDWDQAVLEYIELSRQNPGDLRYRAALMRAKINASVFHFGKAKDYREAGLLTPAMVELRKAVELDPTNQYARAELEKVRDQIEAQRAGTESQTLAEAKEKTRGAMPQPPELSPRSPEPIGLNFPEATSVMQIYQALGKAFGINVLFDPKLRDQEISITLTDVTAQDALEILMRTAGHFYKVLDEHSIIVVADTPQNRRNYEDLIIQTFFLSNSDVKDVMTMLRSLVDSRKIASNEQLNAIVLRDTADKVKVAERIIQANDKAKAEVVVDVELLQLNTNLLQDLGLSLSAYQIGSELDNGGADVPLRFSDLEFIDGNNWVLSIPSFMFDFVKQNTEAQTLAQPKLRISEGERATLTIGDQVPIPVVSFNTANTVGSNVVPLTSFQYQDVGIQIEIEPRVHHNEEVSLQLRVEVSNISGERDGQPIIGTRNIETTIRLKDGETNFLAGLIRTDETNSEEGIPGLAEIPVLGRLFSKKRSQNQRTDIVLTMTPHIIRKANITEEDLMPIWVGTESNITFRGGSPRVESEVDGPFDESSGGEDGDLRRQIRQLPRGLRESAAEEPEEGDDNAPPPGVDLVPVTRPPRDVSFEVPPALRDMGFAPVRGLPLSAPWAQLMTAQSASDPSDRLAIPGAAAVRARLAPRRVQAQPGGLFAITLDLDAKGEVSHVPARLRYDTSALELVQVSQGDLLDRDATETMSFDEGGEIILGVSQFGDLAGRSGSGSAAVLVFRALGQESQTLVELLEVEAIGRDLRPLTTGVGRRAIPVSVSSFPDGGPMGGDRRRTIE
ncbi:MAG: secretin N-terminal domain-containing protein [Acidobacteriota bacterium]